MFEMLLLYSKTLLSDEVYFPATLFQRYEFDIECVSVNVNASTTHVTVS